MSGDIRPVRALVGCYPPAWRRRYGEEYAELLCDMQVQRRPRLVVDSLLGAARAHGGALMSGTSPLTLPVWSAALFTAAGIGFAKLAEDFSGVAVTAYALMVIASAIALLALAAAAAPSAGVLLRGRVAAFALIVATGLGLLAATAGAATTVLRRASATGPDRLRSSAVTAMTVGMAGATVAVLVRGLRVRTTDAAALHSNQGLLATPFVSSWTAVLVALVAASVLTGLATRRHATTT